MKQDVTCKCGHTITMVLCGKNTERESKIKWQEEHDCPECYHQSLVAEGKEQEIRVKYSDYKNDEKYFFCKTKTNSYDKDTKTIVVYMPVEQPVEPAEEATEPAPEEPKELSEETVKELAEEFGLKTTHIRAFAKQGSAKMMEDLNQMLDQTVKSDKFKEDVAINLFKLIIKLKSVGI